MTHEGADFQVTYFDVRGRCEPILLMLVDAGVSYNYSTVSLEEWKEFRRAPIQDQIPYGGLPVLKVQEEGKETLLAETGTILQYLEEKLLPRRYELLEERAQPWMAKDAALFFINRVFQLSVSEAWLSPPSRGIILEHIVLPYLHGTERLLMHFKNPAEGGVDAATAAMFTAFQFSLDMFPTLEKYFESGKEFEKCRDLLVSVASRERIFKWYEEERVRERAWTLSGFGTAAWIREESDKFGQLDHID